jgi:hypothetical protein
MIWGSHVGEYEDGCHQGDRPDDGGSTDLRNVGKLTPVYTALQPRRQPSNKKATNNGQVPTAVKH